jgi:hypothetical protein
MAAFGQGTALIATLLRNNPTSSRNSSGSNAPPKALDFNNSTFWYTGDPSVTGDFIELDFGTVERVGGVVWSSKFGIGAPAGGNVDVSSDGTTWTTVASWTNTNKNAFSDTDVGDGDGGRWFVAWNHVNTRFVRLIQTSGSFSGGWPIEELSIYPGATLAAPTATSWAVDTTGLLLTATLSQVSLTPSGGFNSGGFTLSGTTRTVAAWSISGTTLTLTLSNPVGSSKTVTVSYDGTAGITNGDSALANISNAAVVNNSTVGAPTLGNFTVPSSGTTMTATLSQSDVGPTSGSGAGGFTIHGGSITVQSWSITGSTITLSLSGKIFLNDPGAPFTVDYSSSTGTLTNGEDVLATTSGKTVTNNSQATSSSPDNYSFFGLQG